VGWRCSKDSINKACTGVKFKLGIFVLDTAVSKKVRLMMEQVHPDFGRVELNVTPVYGCSLLSTD